MSHRQPLLAVRTAQCTYAPANPFKPQPHPACAQVATADQYVSTADASRETDVVPTATSCPWPRHSSTLSRNPDIHPQAVPLPIVYTVCRNTVRLSFCP